MYYNLLPIFDGINYMKANLSHIAGYRFMQLDELHDWQNFFLELCQSLNLKGTILLSQEGININLSGTCENIQTFKINLNEKEIFANLFFHTTSAECQPYKRLKVRIKNEIITFKHPLNMGKRAPSIQPELFKQWLDENRDIVVLDTRNQYEIEFGTFKNAMNLKIDDFCQLPATIKTVEKDKPIVMFCTGGIRCEKAAIYMLEQGYSEVYQLHGGILNYFAKVGGSHYQGNCFVFDERIALNSNLESKVV